MSSILLPWVAGHQWNVILQPRVPGRTDDFPLGAEGAEWLCGATLRARAAPPVAEETLAENRIAGFSAEAAGKPQPPPLRGPLAEVAHLRAQLAAIHGSLPWRVARAVARPLRALLKRRR